MSRISTASRIALAAADAEMKNARACGATWFEAYASSYRVLDEMVPMFLSARGLAFYVFNRDE